MSSNGIPGVRVFRLIMKVGKGKRRIYFKKAPVYNSSVQRYGQPTAVTVPVEPSYNRLQSSRKQFKTAPGGGV